MLPIIGKDVGPGGRFLSLLVGNRNLSVIRKRIAREV